MGPRFWVPSGNRVKKVTPTKTEIYVYDAFGKMAAEWEPRAEQARRAAHVRRQQPADQLHHGQRDDHLSLRRQRQPRQEGHADQDRDLRLCSTVATTAPAGAHYRTLDHLGSARLVTLQDQSAFACYDYAPFGEEIPDTLGSRASVACYAGNLDDRQKFTAKERDSESGMDYFLARYYSGPMGRFLSVDPDNAGAGLTDPQTWNAYAYARNAPTVNVDPDGRIVFTAAAIVAFAVATFEVASTALDVHNAVTTVADPNATTAEKVTSVGGVALGAVVPGPGGTIATKAQKGFCVWFQNPSQQVPRSWTKPGTPRCTAS